MKRIGRIREHRFLICKLNFGFQLN